MSACTCAYRVNSLKHTVPSLWLLFLSCLALPPSPPLFNGDSGALDFFLGLVLCCLAPSDTFLDGDETGLGFLLGLEEKQTCLLVAFFLDSSMPLVPTLFLVWTSSSTPLVALVCSLLSEGKWSFSSALSVLLLVRLSTIHTCKDVH